MLFMGLFCGAVLDAQMPQAAPLHAISPPQGAQFYGLTPQFAVSPDGQRVVYVGATGFNPPVLWITTVDGGSATSLNGTEQASYPFWSADSSSIGFFAGGKLKRIPAAGGTPTVVCDAPNGRGGTWNKDEVILFTSGITDPLRKVAAAGGAVSLATALDSPREGSHRWPQFLPDGRHFLYWAGAGNVPASLKIGVLESRDTFEVAPADSNASYGAGRVFFAKSNVLMSQELDPMTYRPSGVPVRVDEPLSGDAGSSFWSVSAAPTGTLLYTKGAARGFVLTWFDRSGRQIAGSGQAGQFTNVALRRDKMCAAVSLTAGTPPNRDIWIRPLNVSFDGGVGFVDAVATCGVQRVTEDPGVDATPIWSPDETRVLYSSQRGGPYQMYVKPLRDQPEERLLTSSVATIATDWCRNGTHVIYTRGSAATGMDVWALPMSGDRTPVAITSGPGAKDNGVCSADGRWVAYQSNESGRDEIYVVSLTDRTVAAVRVSSGGGTQPLWPGDGRELFFLASDGGVMASTVASQAGLQVTPPQKLFPAPVSLVIRRSYDVTVDGRQFLIPVIDDSTPQVIEVKTLGPR
jgi:Tol biopolymer transport system component